MLAFLKNGLYIDEGLIYTMNYLTNISMMLLVIWLGVGIIQAAKPREEHATINTWYNGLLCLCATSQMVVTVFYWSVIAPFSISKYAEWCGALFFCHAHNVAVHGMGNIATMVALFTEPTKIVFKHIWIPIIYMVFYICILIPTTVYGKDIYTGITFKDLKSYAFCVIGVILGVGCFFVVRAISGWKHMKFFGKKLPQNCCG